MSGEGPDHTLVLRPNLSLSWRQAKVFLVVVAGVLVALASGFAVIGLWPVLPLAGVEWLALAAAFYVVQRRGHRMEVVSVRDGRVVVEKGTGGRGPARWEFPLGWVRVHLQPSLVRGYPSRLVLAMHGEEVALGDFLAEDERQQAAELLRRTLVRSVPEAAPGRASWSAFDGRQLSGPARTAGSGHRE